MELYSHRFQSKKSSKFEDHQNLSKDFRIDLYDLCLKFIWEHTGGNQYDGYVLEGPAEELAKLIHRHIDEKPLTKFNNDYDHWHNKIEETLSVKPGSDVFDLVSVFITDPFLSVEIGKIFDKYCLTLKIDEVNGKIIPRLEKEQEEALQTAMQITEEKYPSSNAYLNESLSHFQKW